jgi:two-component system response regulator DesR
MISAALLDDHPAIRAGVQATIEPLPDLRLVGSAAGEPAIWALLERTRPDVLIMDHHHRGRDGLMLCLEIKSQLGPPAVVFYSASMPRPLEVAAGADAIVRKHSPIVELIEAIRAVASSVRPGLSIKPRMKAQAASTLDPRDHAIFAMRLDGDSTIEIAATLGIPRDKVAERTRAIIMAVGLELASCVSFVTLFRIL